jgi:hypothetical protein
MNYELSILLFSIQNSTFKIHNSQMVFADDGTNHPPDPQFFPGLDGRVFGVG